MTRRPNLLGRGLPRSANPERGVTVRRNIAHRLQREDRPRGAPTGVQTRPGVGIKAAGAHCPSHRTRYDADATSVF
jgi:hypothetical protein